MTTANKKTRTAHDHQFNAYRVAKSPTAQGLIAEALTRLASVESQRGAERRQRARRAADQDRYERQIHALVCDLAYRHISDPGRWIFASRSKAVLGKRNRYSAQFITEAFIATMSETARPEAGLSELRVSKAQGPNAQAKAVQSTMRAGPWLIERVQALGLTTKDFGIAEGEEVIVLKRGKDEGEDSGERVDYAETPLTTDMRERLQAINRRLETADVGCWGTEPGEANPLGVDVSRRRLHRVFINGRFEEHGRMYGGFWINMRGQDRRECLTIDGDEVVELDYGQTAIRLLYAEAGQSASFDDAYAVPGLERHRDAVKKVMNAMLSATKPLRRLPPGLRLPPFIDRNGERVQLNLDGLRSLILERHAPVAAWFNPGTAQRLIRRESDIMVEVLLRLIDQGITALPIHDGLLVADKHKAGAFAVMSSVFKEATGLDAVISEEYA